MPSRLKLPVVYLKVGPTNLFRVYSCAQYHLVATVPIVEGTDHPLANSVCHSETQSADRQGYVGERSSNTFNESLDI